jgi:hypothetical protein
MNRPAAAALFFASSRRNSPAKSKSLIVKNNELQSPEDSRAKAVRWAANDRK